MQQNIINNLTITATLACICISLAQASSNQISTVAKKKMPTAANQNLYARFFGGLSMPQKITGYDAQEFESPKLKFMGGAGLGYHLSDNIMADLTLQQTDIQAEHNLENSSLTAKYENLVTFANAYFDLGKLYDLEPYVTVGAGMANVKPKFYWHDTEAGSADKESKANFAWNIGTGIKKHLSVNTTIDVGYRFLDLGSIKHAETSPPELQLPKSKKNFNSKLNAHIFQIGIAYNF